MSREMGFKNMVAIAYDFPSSLLFNDLFVHSFIHFFFFCSLTTKLNIKFLLRYWKILKKAWVNGETSCVHCLEDLILLRWCAPQIVVQTQSNPYQNSNFLLWWANFKIHVKFEGIKNRHKQILKFIWKLKGSRIATTILGEKKWTVEDSHVPISKPITKL